MRVVSGEVIVVVTWRSHFGRSDTTVRRLRVSDVLGGWGEVTVEFSADPMRWRKGEDPGRGDDEEERRIGGRASEEMI